MKDGAKEEMRRLDRLIVSSQRAPRLKPSDYKTIRTRQGQFDALDANRLAYEEELRSLHEDMKEAAKQQQRAERRRGAILAKLDVVQMIPVRLPSPRRD